MLFAQSLDKLSDFDDLLGVQANGGLVQYKDFRAPYQGLCQADPLLVTFGKVF